MVVGSGEDEEQEVTAKRSGVPPWGDVNVLKWIVRMDAQRWEYTEKL